jgi:tetratricopeptide (TPR) repeat protein
MMHFCRIQKLVMLVALFSMLSGCATTRLSLFTNPQGAKVYAKPLGNGRFEFLGETPLQVQGTQIEKQYSGSGPIMIEFRKEGYQHTSTLVTELSSQDLVINQELVPQVGLEDLQRINAIIETMFECQRLVKVGRYDEALTKLKQLEKEAPQISITYELQGGIYYLQKKYPDSLDAYRLAVRYNPRNAEALRMRDMLEKKFGIERDREPANVTPPESPQGQ